jgi:UDP-N-acetylmuramoylalanine--D-glutamate ligase
MDIFKNKKVAIVGEGIEGQSSFKWLKTKGAEVAILDEKQGEDYLKDLDSYDLVLRSPGIKISTLEKFVSREKITSQIKIFFDLCPSEIIGVTGTKGKGTTSSLIYEMLKKQGFDAYLG